MAKSEIIDDLRIAYNGRSFPVWKYDEVPAEMRPATPRDLWYGRPVLFQLQLGEDAGKYCTGIVRTSTIGVLREYLNAGIPVYVKDGPAKH
jgi:hypothetical protein